MKIIAFYLPQFHRIDVNDKNWGEGFTEWENVKSAKSLCKKHIQPRIPYNNNYYDLESTDVLKWQCKLANQYGIYGFCFYHYWFSGKPLMETPIKNLLNNADIKIRYCLSWANESWYKKTGFQKELILKQEYGDKNEWQKHCQFLLPYFMDKRYIKIDGKPVFIIYRPELIERLEDMITYMNQFMCEHGAGEICFIYQYIHYNHKKDKGGRLFSYGIEYQPVYAKYAQMRPPAMLFRKMMNIFFTKSVRNRNRLSLLTLNYDRTWKRILKHKPIDEKIFPGAFVNWDNTPRYGARGSFYGNYSVEKFEKYLEMQIIHSRRIYKKEMLFLFAWNEWGEGGYLEPDIQENYARLKAVKKALASTGE